MTMLDQLKRQVPDPYLGMYLDGYTPYEILEAASRKIYNDHLAQQQEAEPEIIIPNITFKSVVKIK